MSHTSTAPDTTAPDTFESDLAELHKHDYSPRQKEDVEQMMRAQRTLKMNNTQLTKGAKIDASTWGRIRRGIYKQSTLDTHISDLKSHISSLFSREKLAADRKRGGANGGTYIEFNEFTAVSNAITTVLAAGEDSEDKAIWFVAKPGFGKTRMGKEINKGGSQSWLITARPSWRRSYYAGLRQIARVMGVATDSKNAPDLETDIIDAITDKSAVLIFNEVERLHMDLWSFMRTICNETPCGVLITITPEYYRKLLQVKDPAIAQLLRRGEGTIIAADLDEARVIRFLTMHWPALAALKANDPKLLALAARLANEGNTYGGFSCITRIINQMAKDLHGTSEIPGTELLDKKIKAYRDACPVPASALKRAA